MRYTPILLSATLLCSSQLFAQDFQYVGTIQQPINQKAQQVIKAQALKAQPQMKEQNLKLPSSITVLKVQLSDHAWSNLKQKVSDSSLTKMSMSTDQSTIKNSKQLGMNNLPVLDQGPHGTCVTFAASAAISAVLNKGDYVSELCQLQLGSYLANHGYMVSGWDGAFGSAVLNQMQTFGIVSKENQRTQGCSGYKEYPIDTIDEPTNDLPLADYHPLSEALPENISWTVVLDPYQVFVDNINPNTTLQQVKTSINSGDRLIFGVLLLRMDEGFAGAVGKYHATNDTWVLTPEIIDAINSQSAEIGGHEMIITGYDDNATAVDSKGRTHKGLLTLRNSWGTLFGDKGDFYMSYDYFKALTLEAERIRKLY